MTVEQMHLETPEFARKRYIMILLCGLCSFLAYVDRVNISIAIVEMAKELQWTAVEKGNILSSFYLGYLISQICGAYLSKIYGGKKTLAYAVLIWSFFTTWTPYLAKTSFSALIFGRICLGLSEGFTFPVIFYIFAYIVPKEERSRAIAVLDVGVCLGSTFAFFASPYIINYYGWEMMFYSFGVGLGSIWLSLWTVFAFNIETAPELQSFKTQTSHRHIETENSSMVSYLTSIKPMFQHPVTLAIMFCHTAKNMGHYVLLSWIPTYFDEKLGIQKTSLAITAIPYFTMGVVTALTSIFGDRLLKRGLPVPIVRRRFTCSLFLMGALVLLFLSKTQDANTALFLFVICLSCIGSVGVAGYDAAKLDVCSKESVGLFQSVSNTFATLPGLFGVPLVAYIKGDTNEWGNVFLLIAACFCAGSFIFYKYGNCNEVVLK